MAQKTNTKTRSENEPLTDKDLDNFKARLEDKRERLLAGSLNTENPPSTTDKLPDEVDLATAEYEAAFENRLRDRDQFLLKKIERALTRIADGEYDECDSCGDIIAKKRLEARMEATLCIICKEEQEQIEKGFLKKREMREEDFSF
jgi:DnaK suppressor protein